MRFTASNIAAAACAAVLFASPALAAPPTYTTANLGSFGGNVIGSGMNNAGNIVGYAFIGTNEYAFFSDGSTTTRLLGGAANSIARKINNSGLLVGASPYDSVIFDVNTNAVVKDFGSSSDIAVRDINDAGQVTGYVNVPGTTSKHAFFYDGTTIHDVGTLGGASSFGAAINSAGHIVGQSEPVPGGDPHLPAFFWDGTTMHALDSLNPRINSSALDINDLDQIVGSSNFHAVMWDSAGVHDLGPFVPNAQLIEIAINNHAEIVGSFNVAGAQYAFYHDGTTMHDLNSLISPTDANYGLYVFNRAADINDNGQITAVGCWALDQQHCYTFLLTPVPTP